MKKVRLYDLAQVIRSKNSGPFQTTLDVIFDDPELYMQIKASGQITPERVCLRIVSANSYSLILRWDSRSPLTARFPPVQSGTVMSTEPSSTLRWP